MDYDPPILPSFGSSINELRAKAEELRGEWRSRANEWRRTAAIARTAEARLALLQLADRFDVLADQRRAHTLYDET